MRASPVLLGCLVVVFASSSVRGFLAGTCLFCTKTQAELVDLDSRCSTGVDSGLCGCCSRCLKSEGEFCGGFLGHYGKCNYDLYCHQAELFLGFVSGTGDCRARKSEDCGDCNPEQCLVQEQDCKYGAIEDKCGCCVQCLKGPDEACGRDGICTDGYYCYGSVGDSQIGTCRPWTPVDCYAD